MYADTLTSTGSTITLPSSQRGFVGERSRSTATYPAAPQPIPYIAKSAPSPHHGAVAQGAANAEGLDSSADISALVYALDELACGIIIIDAQARVLHANAAGRAVAARGEGVCIDGDTVHTTHRPDAQPFADALIKAAQGKRSMVALGAMACTTVAVVPLRHTPNSNQPLRYVLMFSRVGVCEALMLSFFARAHSLTGAEERILGLLCSGLTAPEMATQLHVGEATVRTHVRSICVKTHSNGIRDVVKRLAVLPPLMTSIAASA
jgi:DNA-binding CsgD family transcriptional regulator